MTERAASGQTQRIAIVRETLERALDARRIEIRDVSARHRGHAEAKDGRAHYEVTIVSERFEKLAALARHRLVYDALGDLMQTDIHAVKITAFTPDRDPCSTP